MSRIFSLCAAALILWAPYAADASGFRVDDHGAPATALGGAFAAQADDPSALYYNPAGLAFLKKGGLVAGTSVQSLGELQFRGEAPGDAAGTSGELDGSNELLLHAHWVKPLAPNLVVGVGAFQPFYLDQEWADAASFSGRHHTTKAKIEALDVNATLSLRLTKRLAVGVGAVYRITEISHQRRLSRFNPLSGADADVATVAVETDQETAYGWNAGLVFKASDSFSFGLAYRSAIEVDYDGAGLLTQIATGDAQFDSLVAATIPFGIDLPVATTLELPETARVGLAFGLGKKATLEVDVDWTGWSSVQSLPFVFLSEPTFDQAVGLKLDDAFTYRFGLRLKQMSGAELRFGFIFDESSQPVTTLNPFLADTDRTSASLGWGKDWLGVAFKWTEFTETTTRSSEEDFNGTYTGNRWSATVSLEL